MNVQSPAHSARPKVKPFPLIGSYPALLRAAQCCPVILAVNWVFQGMRGMDSKELSGRLGAATLVAIAVAGVGSSFGLDARSATVAGWLVAHTSTFALNGQFWVCARYCRSYRRNPAELDRFVTKAVSHLRATPWLDSALLIGSQGLGIGTRTDRSDIDLRLLFPAGCMGWLRCNALLLRWRTAALFGRIPLDLFAYDHAGSLSRFDQAEPLLLIEDRAGLLTARFPHRRWTNPS